MPLPHPPFQTRLCRRKELPFMKRIILQEGRRGFLFKNGKFVRMLGPGKYYTGAGRQIEVLCIGECEVETAVFPTMQAAMSDPDFAAETISCTVADNELAVHMVNGVFADIVRPGTHWFWTVGLYEHSFITVDMNCPEFPADFPAALYARPSLSCVVNRVEVAQKEVGLLFFDNRYIRTLEPGTYYFVKGKVKVDVARVPTCLVTDSITGQEVLTSDKVTVRVNCLCSYRITDCFKAVTETDSFADQLHYAAQLALREFVGARTLDALLASKEELSAFLLARLREKGAGLSLAVEEAAVRDIILPGEVRDIMNTVLVAEKRAQANVITRREEVASTRSLLNTARLMDENTTLYRLKELEYIERICEKVDSINLSGNADLLQLLRGALAPKDGKEDKK